VRADINGNDLSAISMPNAVRTLQTDTTQFYFWDSGTQLMTLAGDVSGQSVVDPAAVTGNAIATSTVPRIDYMAPGLIGVANIGTSAVFYDSSCYPWLKIV